MGRSGILMRIDKKLAELIERKAKEENVSIREASKDILKEMEARARKIKF